MTKIEKVKNSANLTARVDLFCIIENQKTEIRDRMINKVADGLITANESIFYIDEFAKQLNEVLKEFKKKIEYIEV